MASRRAYKSDVSFLEKILMGAVGTRRVFDDLRNQGHTPVELERGSMSFKIWKGIKTKRIRMPDILCVACGRRVESRAKTALEISMSHSSSDPDRGWDYGLDDRDVVALVVCTKKPSGKPTDWEAGKLVQYVPVRHLRWAWKNGAAVPVKPKGREEGFEERIKWPAAIARFSGKVESITSDRICYRRQGDSRSIWMSLSRQTGNLRPIVRNGEAISENQVLAAVVPVWRSFPCSRRTDEQYYIARLSSSSPSERYAAAKALSGFRSENAAKTLIGRLHDNDEDFYVRLEAAASLARRDEEQGWSFVEQCMTDEYLQRRLEAVIVLGEIPGNKSCRLLRRVLTDDRQHAEIRAGAAWALGELRDSSALDVLIDSFSGLDNGIRIEAARALAKLASNFPGDVVRQFPLAARDKRPGIAWALSKSGGFRLEDLLDVLVDEDARHWVTYILGTQDRQKYIGEIEKLKKRDPEVYFAVTVLWKIMTSWVHDLEEY